MLNKKKVILFFIYKTREQEGKTGPAMRKGELIPVGEGMRWGKSVGGYK
jgi:hypothetical protein